MGSTGDGASTAPVAGHVRPTSDRVREAIFDILFSLGGVEGLQVADLFAGTGALGIEALSRGAASVTFVERDPRSIERHPGQPRRRRAWPTPRRRATPPWSAPTSTPGWPPRRLATTSSCAIRPTATTAWESLVTRLPADLAVLESGAVLPAVDGWEVLRSKRYGGTIVTVARPERASQKGVS